MANTSKYLLPGTEAFEYHTHTSVRKFAGMSLLSKHSFIKSSAKSIVPPPPPSRLKAQGSDIFCRVEFSVFSACSLNTRTSYLYNPQLGFGLCDRRHVTDCMWSTANVYTFEKFRTSGTTVVYVAFTWFSLVYWCWPIGPLHCSKSTLPLFAP